jgi:thioesterase domain-containing protein
MGWGAFARHGVDIRIVKGNHVTILREPRVRLLAEALTKALEEESSRIEFTSELALSNEKGERG